MIGRFRWRLERAVDISSAVIVWSFAALCLAVQWTVEFAILLFTALVIVAHETLTAEI